MTPLTDAQREQLAELEKRQRFYMLRIHQARLMCSALRREIRISRTSRAKSDRPGQITCEVFSRLDKIQIYSDELLTMVKELRA